MLLLLSSSSSSLSMLLLLLFWSICRCIYLSCTCTSVIACFSMMFWLIHSVFALHLNAYFLCLFFYHLLLLRLWNKEIIGLIPDNLFFNNIHFSHTSTLFAWTKLVVSPSFYLFQAGFVVSLIHYIYYPLSNSLQLSCLMDWCRSTTCSRCSLFCDLLVNPWARKASSSSCHLNQSQTLFSTFSCLRNFFLGKTSKFYVFIRIYK